MTKLGSYELIGKMTNHNSGYSVWGFGKKHGAEFFIKEFLSPKYPANDTASTPQQLEKRRKRCEQFAFSKTNLYRVVNQ